MSAILSCIKKNRGHGPLLRISKKDLFLFWLEIELA